MIATILLMTPPSVETNTSAGYIFGSVIALLILGYLVFTLIRPEKF